MRFIRRLKLRVFLVTLIVSAMLVLGQARRADAQGEAAVVYVFLAATLAATYITVKTVMGVVCTPIAAIMASDYPEGFSGAFGDCFAFELNSDQTAPTGENNDASDKPAEEADEGRYPDFGS